MKYKIVIITGILLSSCSLSQIKTTVNQNYHNTLKTEYFDELSNMYIKDYDINKDGKIDVREWYGFQGKKNKNKLEMVIDKNPLLYGFDLDGDGEFTLDEMLIDTNKDGLNGNEKNLYNELLPKEDQKENRKWTVKTFSQ